MKTLSKGRIFSVSTEVSDEQLKALKAAPEHVQASLTAVALQWHSTILPRHFETSAHDRYGYAERARSYLKQKHGRADLQSPMSSGHSGKMKTELLQRAQVRKFGATGVSLKLTARAFNFAGRGADASLAVKVPNSKGVNYPNLPKEVRQLTDDEQELLRSATEKALIAVFAATAEMPEVSRTPSARSRDSNGRFI